MAKRKKKEQAKRSWMVGVLMIVMLAFVASQIPWDRIIKSRTSKSSATTSSSSASKSNASTKSNTVFVKEGKLTFFDAGQKEKISVDIEVSDTEEERALGLMHRRTLPSNGGMLFIFDQDRQQNFWMKNTYLSLDFVFINSENKIVSIQENVAPLSEQGVPSNALAKYVLELNAGFISGYNLQVGDMVNIELAN